MNPFAFFKKIVFKKNTHIEIHPIGSLDVETEDKRIEELHDLALFYHARGRGMIGRRKDDQHQD